MATALRSAYTPTQLTRSNARWRLNKTLLVATGNATSGWWDTFGIHPFTITIDGGASTFTATVTVYGCNREDAPPDTDTAHAIIGAPMTQPGSIGSDGPHRWVKVDVTGYSGGTITAGLMAAVTTNEKG